MSALASFSNIRRMVGHASIYAAGNIMRQLVGFLMLPVYTRYLTPADYGVVGLITFAISLIEPLFGARLGMAIPKYYSDAQDSKSQATVVSTALVITGFVSTITTVFLVFLRTPTSQGLFGTTEYSTIVGFFAVLIVTQALEQYALVFIRLQQRPWVFVGVNLVKLIIQLSLNIWLVVFMELGVLGIAVSAMASSTAFAVLLMAYTLRHVGFGFDRILAGKLFRFCWPLWLAGLAGLYIGSSNRFYLRLFSSLDDVGLYELAVKFAGIITLLVWQPFQQYWQVERFRCHKLDDAEAIFQNVFSIASILLVLAALGVAIYAQPVIRVMAAPEFHRASIAVPFLSFGAVFASLVIFLNFSFFISEETKWISRINYFIAAVITIFYLLLIPRWGYVGAALSLLLAQAVQFIVTYYIGARFYDMGISLKPLGRILLIAAIASWLANEMVTGTSLWEDVALKSPIYLIAVLLTLLPVWANPKSRSFAREFIHSLPGRG